MKHFNIDKEMFKLLYSYPEVPAFMNESCSILAVIPTEVEGSGCKHRSANVCYIVPKNQTSRLINT